MKKILSILLLLSQVVIAQQRGFTARITISEASTNFTFQKGINGQFYGYGGGASALSPGIETEIRLAPIRFKKALKVMGIYNTSNKALLIGVNYAEHDFSVRGFSADNDITYSSFQTRYLNVPVVLKYNVQIFMLDENFHFSFGLGTMNSFLLRSHLHEEATDNDRDSQGRVIASRYYIDDKDVTKLGVKYTTNFCFDISVSFKRLYIGERAYFGFKDQFMKGLASTWAVPGDLSIYQSAYETSPKLTMSGGFFYIGWRLF
jgi:hypothetical protein